jgi:RNA polymerase sigma-70 factor (ECF subfamily)
MGEQKFLADEFEAERPRLKSLAYRMLGDQSEAEDAVQDAWLRLARSERGEIANLRAWLTTVVARLCLDMLRAKKARREEGDESLVEIASQEDNGERERALADEIGVAMLVVLETLTPAERVAFVLHDMFDLPFDDIAPILGRTSEATRQLASRARRRVRGGGDVDAQDRARKERLVGAFLTASRTGDLTGLIAVLDPNVVLHADTIAVAAAGRSGGAFPLPAALSGRDAVANLFKGRAQAARMAVVDDDIAAIYAPGGKAQVVFSFTLKEGRIGAIDIIADPERIRAMEIAPPG